MRRARRGRAELAARQRRRRGHAARDEARLGVEIEGEADDVAGHCVTCHAAATGGASSIRRMLRDARLRPSHAHVRLPQVDWIARDLRAANDEHRAHGHPHHRHHPQRRDRAHLLDAARRQRAGADPRRGRAAGRRRPHRAAADAGRPQRREARGRRQELRRGMDHRPRRGAGRSGLHRVLRRRRDPPARRRRWTRRSPPASTSIPRSRSRCRSEQGRELLRAAQARGLKHGAVEDKLYLPGLQKLVEARGVRFLRPRHRLPHRIRLVGVRRHRGGLPAAELELPQERRRRADPRHVSALALRDREHCSARSAASSARCRPRRRSAIDEQRRALRGRRRGQRRDPGRAGKRRDRHHPRLLGDAGAPRRPAHRPDRRHRRAPPSPACTAASPPPTRRRRAPRISTSRPTWASTIAPTGTRSPTPGRSRTPIASAGRTSSAISSPARRCRPTSPPASATWQFAEACYPQHEGRTWISLEPRS